MEEKNYRATSFGEIHYDRNHTELIPEIQKIDQSLAENRNQPELWMERGKILRKKQLLCREAVESHSMGLTFDPFNPLLYRYRGHVCINIGRYIEGAADFELSLRLDPSNWDTWYHLGLAYYLLGDFQRARKAYEGCIEATKPEDNESLVAVTDWYWLTMMHLGEEELAQAALDKIDPNWTIVDNKAYFNRLLAYKGIRTAEEVYKEADAMEDDIQFATQTYGLSYYYEAKGDLETAKKILMRIMERSETAWSCFAVRAAEVRLQNWQ